MKQARDRFDQMFHSFLDQGMMGARNKWSLIITLLEQAQDLDDLYWLETKVFSYCGLCRLYSSCCYDCIMKLEMGEACANQAPFKEIGKLFGRYGHGVEELFIDKRAKFLQQAHSILNTLEKLEEPKSSPPWEIKTSKDNPRPRIKIYNGEELAFIICADDLGSMYVLSPAGFGDTWVGRDSDAVSEFTITFSPR